MRTDEIVSELESRLAGKAETFFRRNDRRIYVDVPPEHTLAANACLFKEMGGRLATATGKDCPGRIEVLYHYCFDSDGIVVTLRTWADKPACELDSIANMFPGVNFVEREIQDLLGVCFLNHPDPRRLLLADDWPEGVYPLRREQPTRREREETPEFLRELTSEVMTP